MINYNSPENILKKHLEQDPDKVMLVSIKGSEFTCDISSNKIGNDENLGHLLLMQKTLSLLVDKTLEKHGVKL